MNALVKLSDNELDAIVTHAGCLREALKKVSSADMVPFFREELTLLEETSIGLLEIRGVRSPDGFWDETEASV